MNPIPRFVRLVVDVARFGVSAVKGAIRLATGPGAFPDSIRTTDSTGEVLDLAPGEYEEMRRDLRQGDNHV